MSFKHTLIVSIVVLLITCFLVAIVRMYSKRTSIQDSNASIVYESREGITKESDVLAGQDFNKFSIKGKVKSKPVLIGDIWYIEVGVKDRRFLLRLGKTNNVLGVNESKNGIASQTYNIKEVQYVIEKIRDNALVEVLLVTKYAEDIQINSNCKQQCQESSELVNKNGQEVEDILLSSDKTQESTILDVPIAQITFDTN